MAQDNEQKSIIVAENKNLKLELDLYKTGIVQLEELTKELQQSEQNYRLLYEYAGVGIGYYESDGTIISFNNLAAKNMGGVPSDFAGKSIFDIFSKSSADIYFKRMKLALASDNQVEYEDFIDLPPGKRWFLTVFSKISTLNSDINRVQIISQDITERKNEQQLILETKIRDEAILNSIGDAVFACDKDGKIILFNKMAETLIEIPKNKAIGSHYSRIVNFVNESTGKASNDFVAEAIRDNKITAMNNHVVLVLKDGRKIPVADSAAPVNDSDGKILGCVVVFHDVTRERQIDKAKTEFVSLASHQLRTPLSTINWYTEMLLSEDVGAFSLKQRQYTQEVSSASRRMVDLVDSLLNVSRLELGTFEVDPKLVNVVKIVKNCFKEFTQQIAKKKLVVKQKYYEGIPDIKVDPKLFVIIVLNILSNSIKYSNSGGKITLSISKDNGNFILAIADNGVGIPKEQQSEIFGKLFRADNAKKMDPDGTGLGLYIVKEIVYYSGGKVWFKSSEGKGTTFYVSLPLTGMKKKLGSKGLD